jgi:hypothetical protein
VPILSIVVVSIRGFSSVSNSVKSIDSNSVSGIWNYSTDSFPAKRTTLIDARLTSDSTNDYITSSENFDLPIFIGSQF